MSWQFVNNHSVGEILREVAVAHGLLHARAACRVTVTVEAVDEDDAMMLTRNNGLSDKKDLHVGGLGASGPVAVATMVSRDAGDVLQTLQPLIRKARSAMQNATYVVRDNPLSALALVGLVGVAAGYLLSRRY